MSEQRVEAGNEVMRLDFDPRTSDTMYNYIWVKRADTGLRPSPRPRLRLFAPPSA